MAKTPVKPAEKAQPKAEEKPSTAVALPEKKNEVSVNLAETMFLNNETGFENVTARDLIIPRLVILQGLSPQMQRSKPEYIKEAKIGDICDVGTSELFEPPLMFLPVAYVKQWLEWAPRASGKGLVAIHATSDVLEGATPDSKGKPFMPNGNYISETAQFFGLNLSAGARRCFLPMASTQLKKAKKWLSLATSEKIERSDKSVFTPPLWYRVYQLGTVEETNNEGSWIGWKIERGPALPEWSPQWMNILAEVESYRKAIAAGEVRGDVSDADELGTTRDAEGGDM